MRNLTHKVLRDLLKPSSNRVMRKSTGFVIFKQISVFVISAEQFISAVSGQGNGYMFFHET